MLTFNTTSSLLDFFIRQTAKRTLIPESIVEIIVKDSWASANKAAQNLSQIEISNIGTFAPYPKKTLNRIRYYDMAMQKIGVSIMNTNPEDPKRTKLQKIMESMEKASRLIKEKAYESIEKYLAKQRQDTKWPGKQDCRKE